jgi:hypothetical protein
VGTCVGWSLDSLKLSFPKGAFYGASYHDYHHHHHCGPTPASLPALVFHLLCRSLILSITGALCLLWRVFPHPWLTLGTLAAALIYFGYTKWMAYCTAFHPQCHEFCASCHGPRVPGSLLPPCSGQCVKAKRHLGPHACPKSCPPEDYFSLCPDPALGPGAEDWTSEPSDDWDLIDELAEPAAQSWDSVGAPRSDLAAPIWPQAGWAVQFCDSFLASHSLPELQDDRGRRAVSAPCPLQGQGHRIFDTCESLAAFETADLNTTLAAAAGPQPLRTAPISSSLGGRGRQKGAQKGKGDSSSQGLVLYPASQVRRLRNYAVSVPPHSTDPEAWKAAEETLGFALGQTLRHSAHQMGLQALREDDLTTSWFSIDDILAHPRFSCWGHSVEDVHREVEFNTKSRFVLHPMARTFQLGMVSRWWTKVG